MPPALGARPPADERRRALMACSETGIPGRPPPASRAETERDAGNDPEEPAEHCARDDDPNERGVSGADHPAELHLARVGNDEGNQYDEQCHETERQRVEPGATAVSSQPFDARLDAFCLRRCLRWRRLELRLVGLL